MAEQFRITGETAATVVVVTVCMYLALILLVRVLGQRSLASLSSFDLGCVVALGAVLGRTVLLEDPTLMIGVVALGTLFAMQFVLGVLRQSRLLDRVVNRSPVLLMAGPEVLSERMRRAHVAEDDLRQALRRAGVRSRAEVRCVILERNGAISVLAGDDPLDPWLLSGVEGAELLQVR